MPADPSSNPCARILTATEARDSILRRGLLQDSTVPPHVQTRIDALFSAPTTPLACVQAILSSIRESGDGALIDWTSRIDGADISAGSELPVAALQTAVKATPAAVVDSLRVARDRVVAFHRKQPVTSWFTNDLGGVLGQAVRPIQRVGFYVPGGTAPLPSTVLMSVLPAVVAGCEELVVASPPLRGGGADIAAVTLAACAVINELPGVRVRVFAIGGAQAIGALAYGTETVPRVDKIVGPGNIFVAMAKREVFGVVGIDGVYGPTEAVVIADEAANAECVAADLLAQAEHDYLAVPILLTTCADLAKKVQEEVETQVDKLPRAKVARHSMANQGGIVVGKDMDECVDMANEFATEHVSLCVKGPWDVVGKMKNAGGLFLGEASCEVLGDYVAGPSHVMPTGGSARYSSPLSVLDFIKVMSVVGLDDTTVKRIAVDAERIARAEGLDGHAEAARMRAQD
ncbi:histidinol dehydrogenase [Chondrus crispus]|uniref:Histidinol dehydrogenase n=1 Tax=Chondrus crispus TaxID=2769 RepID=R7Q4W7_CHOCR|nr:histidinol dehydrogenase [Chondrus crispus]CDF33054.1 histidinol dehydrogenase [Chondrus crispus]|eukprot:XP_005712857.1 histidinol dehydrogenase [Chondrus crispus]